MLIELMQDFYFDQETGTVLKGTGKDECALFPPGASAVDGGFALPCSAREVADALNDREEDEPDDEEDDEDDEGDEED